MGLEVFSGGMILYTPFPVNAICMSGHCVVLNALPYILKVHVVYSGIPYLLISPLIMIHNIAVSLHPKMYIMYLIIVILQIHI